MKKFIASLLLLATLITIVGLIPSTFANTTSSGCEHPFTDIIGHWSKEAVCQLYNSGVVQGYSEKNFNLNGNITRAEFTQILVLSMGYNVYAVQSAAFSDTKTSEWFYAVVSFAHSKGLVNGYSDNTFKPNNNISRAEAIALLVNAAGYIGADTSDLNHTFYDVKSTDWFATALAVGLQNSIVEGYGDGSFRPNNPVSRAEACVMLVQALNTIL